jgi:DNA replication protein DnaC
MIYPDLSKPDGYINMGDVAHFIGLPAKVFETHNFATFNVIAGNKEAFDACQLFLTDKREHFFLTLSAPCGRGKSHLAIATLIKFIMAQSSQYSAKYYQTESLLDDLRRLFDNFNDKEDTYSKTLNLLKRTKLLVIDDMGAEKSTEWAKAKLDEIIDDRYLNQRLTIVTTNLAADALPPRIASRLREGVVVVVKGDDYRLIKAKERGTKK